MKNLFFTFLKSGLSLVFMVVTALWGAFITLQSMMDVKVAKATTDMRVERTAQINELRAEIHGVKQLSVSMDRKMDIIIQNQLGEKAK